MLKRKKTISVLLSTALLSTLIVSAWAADQPAVPISEAPETQEQLHGVLDQLEYEEWNDGTICITGHSGDFRGELVIPEMIDGKKVTGITYHLVMDNHGRPGLGMPMPVGAFSGCTGLTAVTLPAGVTYIGKDAFAGCSGLTAVTIPAGVNAISEQAFLNCVGLTEVTLSEGLTSIGDRVFSGCTGLTAVTIPASVTQIGLEAFQGCSSLRDLYYGGSEAQWNEIAQNEIGLLETTVIHYNSVSDVPAPDGPSDWAGAEVNEAIQAGIVPSALQNNYQTPITRAEFCALTAAVYETKTGSEITGHKTFTDTTDPNVEKMAFLGVVYGKGEDRFDPDGGLTRQEAAAMLARLSAVMGKPLDNVPHSFADAADIAGWAVDDVSRAAAAGIMEGVGDQRFDPLGTYTREQSILTAFRLFSLL